MSNWLLNASGNYYSVACVVNLIQCFAPCVQWIRIRLSQLRRPLDLTSEVQRDGGLVCRMMGEVDWTLYNVYRHLNSAHGIGKIGFESWIVEFTKISHSYDATPLERG